MNIRVISGQYGGRALRAPIGSQTHPMSERARNAMFNSLGQTVKEAKVLDAFAGTGAIGIEALSRGASKVTFIERDQTAAGCIDHNLTTLGIGDEATLIRSSVSNWLSTAELSSFDLIFADPPYSDEQLSTVIRLFELLKPGALMVLSHTGKGEVPLRTNEIVVVDSRSYANAHLTFFRREAN